MKEQVISFKTAKLAKEKGFNWECFGLYYLKHPEEEINVLTYDKHPLGLNPHKYGFCDWNSDDFLFKDEIKRISAPTQSLLQKWLRDKHNLHITIFSSSQESWMFRITKPHQQLKDGIYGEDFYTYEEALESGLQETLKLI